MPPIPSSHGVEVVADDLGGHGPPLLMAHATGFCAATWRPVARHLTRFRCVAVDFRCHGRSSGPLDGDLDWHGMADDVLATVDAMALERPVAAGHSMGGAALLLAEVARPGTFAALWLYEPIVMPPEVAALSRTEGGNALAVAAARRRDRFADRATARANFAGKPPMSDFDPEALDAYLDGGFEVEPDGGLRLRCAPADESRLYLMGARHDAADRLGEVRCPVTVARGRPEPGPAQFAPAVAAGLPEGRLEDHPDLGHFGPMEDPRAIAAAIAAALGPGCP